MWGTLRVLTFVAGKWCNLHGLDIPIRIVAFQLASTNLDREDSQIGESVLRGVLSVCDRNNLFRSVGFVTVIHAVHKRDLSWTDNSKTPFNFSLSIKHYSQNTKKWSGALHYKIRQFLDPINVSL